jgi:tripartite-type tricarboxylate transporter receptor subunit TctC
MHQPLRRAILCAAAAACAAPLIAGAQGAFPSRPLRLVVPYPPGASTDNLSRALAQELGKELGQNVVVENRPGAGTAIGTQTAKAAPADGYTLLFHSDGFFSAKVTLPSAGYEFSDFEVVAPLAQTAYALVTPAALKLANLNELAAHVRKSGEFTLGILGNGPNQYTIMGESLAKAYGVKLRTIPYKGGMEGITAIAQGDIDGYFATVSLAHTQRDNAKLKALGVSSERGNRFLPGVQSFTEAGIKDLVMTTSFGIAVRSDTPADIKARLVRSIGKVAASEPMKKARQTLSLDDFPGTLADYHRDGEQAIRMYQEAKRATRAAN